MSREVEDILNEMEEKREEDITVRQEKVLIAESKLELIRVLVLGNDSNLISEQQFADRIKDHGFDVVEMNGQMEVYSTPESEFPHTVARQAFKLVKNETHPDMGLPSVEEEADKVFLPS